LNKFNYLSTYYDSIISLNIAAVLSGTHQNAANAAKEIEEITEKKITAINSKSVSAGLGLLVLRTLEALKEGPTHDELVDKIHSWIPKIRIYVVTKTVKYMVRGGRLSPVKGLVANMLNLKPIISFDEEGRAYSFNRSFGKRNSLKKIRKIIIEHLNSNTLWNYALIFSDPGEKQSAIEYGKKLTSLIGKPPAFIESIAPVVGVNAGPGTIAVMLMFE
jgi:DegV family protein with EDD domain